MSTPKARKGAQRQVDAANDKALIGELVAPAEVAELRRTALVRLDPTRRLVRVSEPLPVSLAGSSQLLEDLAAAGRLAERSIATSTAAVYDLNLSYWESYCRTHGVAAYPPVPGVVMAWVASMANRKNDADGNRVQATGLHHKTIVQRLAALSKLCAAQGWPKPTDHPDVAEVLSGCRRTLGVRARRQVAPMDLEVMRCVISTLHKPTDTQLRDATVLVLAQHPEIRVGTLARIVWPDITIDEATATVMQPTAARHGEARPVVFAATGTDMCPVAALARWREVCEPKSLWLVPRITAEGIDSQPIVGREGAHRIVRNARSHVGVEAVLNNNQLAAAFEATMALTPWAVRDKSMLLTAFFTASRRSNVSRLTFRYMSHDPRKGVRVFFDRTKTDQDGVGEEKWLPFGKNPQNCPVAAFLDWHAMLTDMLGFDPAGTDTPVFCSLTKGGNIAVDANGVPQPLSGETFADVVQRRVKDAGYDPAMFAGHSLRSGFITSAAEQGVRIDQIQRVSGHKNIQVLMGYIRSVESWKDNPAAAIGL